MTFIAFNKIHNIHQTPKILQKSLDRQGVQIMSGIMETPHDIASSLKTQTGLAILRRPPLAKVNEIGEAVLTIQ